MWIGFSGSRLGIGIVIAVIVGIMIWVFLWRTKSGYEQRMTQGARKICRIWGDSQQSALLSERCLLSGALSGLAGAIQILGVERRIVDGFAASGMGFDGVLIAILAKESILGIFIVGTLFAGLQIGSINLQFGDIPRQLGSMIIALIILFTSMEDFFRDWITRIRLRFTPTSENHQRKNLEMYKPC